MRRHERRWHGGSEPTATVHLRRSSASAVAACTFLMANDTSATFLGLLEACPFPQEPLPGHVARYLVLSPARSGSRGRSAAQVVDDVAGVGADTADEVGGDR